MRRTGIILCLLGLLFSSCVENVSLDTGEDIIHVYCILNGESEQHLKLTHIASSGEGETPVNQADVQLYEDGNPVGSFFCTGDGNWVIYYTPIGGHTYQIGINKSIWAETRFPIVEYCHESRGVMNPGSLMPKTYIGFEIQSKEDLNVWSYFETKGDKKGYGDFILSDHPMTDNSFITEMVWEPLEFVLNKGYSTSISWCFQFGDVPENYYLHKNFLHFIHPAGFSRTFDETVFRPVPDVGDRKTSIFGIMAVHPEETDADLVFLITDDSYNNYLKSVEREINKEFDDDFIDMVYKKNVYSNIDGGAGIFGVAIEFRFTNMISHRY